MSETQASSGIRADETVRFTGTEPFWGGQVAGPTLTYSTPEDPDGTPIAVSSNREPDPTAPPAP